MLILHERVSASISSSNKIIAFCYASQNVCYHANQTKALPFVMHRKMFLITPTKFKISYEVFCQKYRFGTV
jgi:hypothetical protein